jgi:hypothetical protein
MPRGGRSIDLQCQQGKIEKPWQYPSTTEGATELWNDFFHDRSKVQTCKEFGQL